MVATSTTSAISYVRDELSNMRLGLALEVATTIGAVLGGLTASYMSREALSAIFGAAMIGVSFYLLKNGADAALEEAPVDLGRLGGRYHDPALGREVRYRVRGLPFGLAISFLAGNLSGLLGIGGGPLKVPAMTLGMGVPMKAAVATSNFMIGVTACASAALYYVRGLVDPLVAVPACLGVTLGAFAGARLTPRLKSRSLTRALAVVLLALAAQMLLAAAGVRLR